MVKCERCGTEDENKVFPEFKCHRCKDTKIDSKLLKPLVKKVRKNFRKLKQNFNLLKNLYIFGSYAEGKLKCGDVDILMIFNGSLLSEFIESKLKFQREKIWDDFGIDEDLNAVVSYLSKEAFFDFRQCQEYPDGCLGCFEQEGCDYDANYWRERPNYCLTECKNARIPTCMDYYDPFCNWHKSWDLDEAQRLFFAQIGTKVKKGADKSFKDSRLEVKVLHLFCYTSIKEFYDNNEAVELRLLE